MTGTGRDRLRELLDAVLDEQHGTLVEMAGGAYASPFHFARLLRQNAGEPPVSMRRRVMLERAAWQIAEGASVTDAAFAAGYESVEGFARAFARAFGHPPSTPTGSPLASGSQRHPLPPAHVAVGAEHGATHEPDHRDARPPRPRRHPPPHRARQGGGRRRLTRPPWAKGQTVLSFDGPDDSLATLLEHLVGTKEIWLAAIEGADFPHGAPRDPASLLDRHDSVAPRWLATVRDLDARGAWDDRLVDALCDPPESFVMGSVFAHVVTFSAARRQLARQVLRTHGVEVDSGDPITWLRSQQGETT